jgi:ATP-dependent Zn protease
MPGVKEREQIWRVQMHPRLTPLADDVDFAALAQRYEVTGGDIRNAVLKAAMTAAAEPGPDADKSIHHRHLDEGIRQVVAAKAVMRQSLLAPVIEETNIRELVPASTRLMFNVPLAVAGTLLSLGLSTAALIIALLR